MRWFAHVGSAPMRFQWILIDEAAIELRLFERSPEVLTGRLVSADQQGEEEARRLWVYL